MTIPISKIERFVSEMEARLAPAPDRTRFLRLMTNLGPGETADSAIAKHLAEHPEDRERAHWLAWIWTGVSRAGGDRPHDNPIAEQNCHGAVIVTEAAPELPATVAETKPAAAPPAAEPKAESEEPEPEVVPGFGRRLHYPPSGFWP
jgi:hypothetical protein